MAKASKKSPIRSPRRGHSTGSLAVDQDTRRKHGPHKNLRHNSCPILKTSLQSTTGLTSQQLAKQSTLEHSKRRMPMHQLTGQLPRLRRWQGNCVVRPWSSSQQAPRLIPSVNNPTSPPLSERHCNFRFRQDAVRRHTICLTRHLPLAAFQPTEHTFNHNIQSRRNRDQLTRQRNRKINQ